MRPKRFMGRTEFQTWKTITREPTVGKGNTIYESEMALFSECMPCVLEKDLTPPTLSERGNNSLVVECCRLTRHSCSSQCFSSLPSKEENYDSQS